MRIIDVEQIIYFEEEILGPHLLIPSKHIQLGHFNQNPFPWGGITMIHIRLAFNGLNGVGELLEEPHGNKG